MFINATVDEKFSFMFCFIFLYLVCCPEHCPEVAFQGFQISTEGA